MIAGNFRSINFLQFSIFNFSVSIVSNAAGVPPCNLQNLGELEQALSNSMFANSQREKMANAIIQNGFVIF